MTSAYDLLIGKKPNWIDHSKKEAGRQKSK
jgi:hypothetical protein